MKRVLAAFLVGMFLLTGFYVYMDQVYFAPTADFTTVGAGGSSGSGQDDPFAKVTDKDGKLYYSHEKKYMAVVKNTSVKIYERGKPNDPQTVDLNGRLISYFDWLPDRDLAIMGLYGDDSRGEVLLEQYNPEKVDHKVDATIGDLPKGSKISDIAYSTATNVIYMKVQVGENQYRIYRTDANYDTRRIHAQATDIGRVAVFYDKDQFFYDNLRTGDVFMYDDSEGSWRVINPPGRYLLIGVDKDQNIYIANVNKDNAVLSVSKGKLGVGFTKIYTYSEPAAMSDVSIYSVTEEIKKNGAGTTDTKNQ